MKPKLFENNGAMQDVKTPRLNGKAPEERPPANENRPRRRPNVQLNFYADLQEDAKNYAIKSWALETKEKELRPKIEHALAMARDAFCDGFDPQTFLADSLQEQEFKKLSRDREEKENAVKHAFSLVEELERERAKIKPCGVAPKAPSSLWKAACVAVIGMTVTVTLHDQLILVSDEIIAWIGATILGLLCGYCVVHLLLSHSATEAMESERNRWIKWRGVVASIILGLAFLVVRLAPVSDFTGLLTALGVTGVEIAIVLGLHAYAGCYSQKLKQWQEQESPYAQLTERVAVAKAHLEARQQELQKDNQAYEDYVAYQDERLLRSKKRTEIEELAVKAVIDGYHEGVAINRGRVQGLEKGGQP